MEKFKVIDTTADNILDYGVCGYKSLKRAGYPEKIGWLKEQFEQGLKIKTLYTEDGGNQGMIEYLPGEYAWRPVDATGYMFIHCLFVGFKKIFKGKGYASLLLEECLKDAKEQGMKGVAVVTRKGSFMVGKELFIKNGFEVVDKAKPDFELVVKKFDANAPNPKFTVNRGQAQEKYNEGLTIIRADQCPYSVKNVNEICEVAKTNYGLTANVINLKNYKEAQESPCPFGVFCIIYNGEIVAEHPISQKRFMNIMDKILK